MSLFSLQINPWGLLFSIVLLSTLLIMQWLYRKSEQSPSVLYSDTQGLETIEKTWRVIWINVPVWLKKIAFLVFMLAVCDPIVTLPKKSNNPLAQQDSKDQKALQQQGLEQVRIPTEGLAIYFVLDQSGSMRAEIDFSMKGLSSKRTTRIDVLKFFTTQFINGSEELGLKGRPNDLIGVIAFARVPKIISPLTLDHAEVNRLLNNFAPVTHPSEEGTAMGYAIYKTAHTIAATEHFAKELPEDQKPAYNIKSTVMILVTDGLQNPSSDDLEHPIRRIGVKEAAEFAKEKGIRLYIISIQPPIDFVGVSAQLAQQKEAAELTGGQFYLASDAQSLHRIYRVIDSLERAKLHGTQKNQVKVEENVQSKTQIGMQIVPLFSYLIVVAMMFVLGAILLETTLLKRVP